LKEPQILEGNVLHHQSGLGHNQSLPARQYKKRGIKKNGAPTQARRSNP
jgi:hypothetical protein